MVNKHTLDYHPILSQLISRIHHLIFLWTPKGFISPKSFLTSFLNLDTPPWLQKSFKFIVLRLLANTYVSKKIESVHFYSCPLAEFSPSFYHYSPGRRKLPISPEEYFLKIHDFPSEKGGEDYGVENVTKIKPRRELV